MMAKDKTKKAKAAPRPRTTYIKAQDKADTLIAALTGNGDYPWLSFRDLLAMTGLNGAQIKNTLAYIRRSDHFEEDWTVVCDRTNFLYNLTKDAAVIRTATAVGHGDMNTRVNTLHHQATLALKDKKAPKAERRIAKMIETNLGNLLRSIEAQKEDVAEEIVDRHLPTTLVQVLATVGA